MDIAVSTVGLLVILGCSLVYVFFGYRFFKLLLSVAGALIFSSVAWKISSEYFIDNRLIALLITIVFGAIGAWLFHTLFKVAAFLYGAAAGLSLSPVILTWFNEPELWLQWALPVICALAGGVILLISHRMVLVTMTSASGSLYFCLSLLLLLVQFKAVHPDILEKPDHLQAVIFIGTFIILFFAGWIYQIKDKHSKES